MSTLLERERDKIRKETNNERIVEVAKEMSSSTEEADLIVEIHKNRIFPGHLTLREQLEEAQAIANRKRFKSENSELKRALNSKENASNDSSTTIRDGQTGSSPKMNSADEAAYKRAGYSYDSKSKLWKKKLPNGKTLIKDPKSNVTYMQ